MSHRFTRDVSVSAAKSGFSTASGYRIEADPLANVWDAEGVALNHKKALPSLPRGAPDGAASGRAKACTGNQADHADSIAPGKPIRNACVENLNGRFRDECLNEYRFRGM